MSELPAYFSTVSQGGTISRGQPIQSSLLQGGSLIPYNPRSGFRRINVPVVAPMQGQKRWMRPFVTKKDKHKRKRHFPYKLKIPRLVPLQKIGTIRWVSDDLSYTPAANAGSLTWKMNDFYDPGFNLTNQRVKNYTELANMYVNYKVIATKWTIHLSNTTADQVQGAWMVCTYTGVTPSDAAGLTETIQKGHPFWIGATDENLSNHIDLHGAWNLKVACSKAGVSNDKDYGAAFGASPAISEVAHIVFGSASNLSLKYRIVQEMTVILYNLAQNNPD